MDFGFRSREKDKNRIWRVKKGSRRAFATSLIKYAVHNPGNERRTPGILCLFFCSFFLCTCPHSSTNESGNRHLDPFFFPRNADSCLLRNKPPPPTHNKSKPWNSFEKHQGLPLINFSFHLALTQCWKHVVQFSFKWKLLTWIHEGSSFFSSLSLFPTLPLRGRFRFKFFLTFYCEAFKDTEKWKECFSEHLYTHHLFYILLNSLHNTPFHLAVFSIHSLNLSFRLCYTSPKHFSMHVIT